MSVYKQITDKISEGKKQLALLLDPDKYDDNKLARLESVLNRCSPSIILVGGSLVVSDVALFIEKIKKITSIPLIIFPGSMTQIASGADAVLFLSLISGRNPEFLIGQHINSAPFIKKLNVETIPTGYMLIDGGRITSVQSMSNTTPIPSDKIDIAMATALAGEMLGMKMLYLEAGSGAHNAVPPTLIRSVVNEVTIPVIVGGGINTPDKLRAAFDAGAHIAVIGNALEKDIEMLEQFSKIAEELSM